MQWLKLRIRAWVMDWLDITDLWTLIDDGKFDEAQKIINSAQKIIDSAQRVRDLPETTRAESLIHF